MQKGARPLPFRCPSGCKKRVKLGVLRLVGVKKGIRLVKHLHQNPLVKLSRGLPANLGLPGKVGWLVFALSAHLGYMVPCQPMKIIL